MQQRLIQDPVRHMMKFFAKIINQIQPLFLLARKLHQRCFTSSHVRLCASKQNFGVLLDITFFIKAQNVTNSKVRVYSFHLRGGNRTRMVTKRLFRFSEQRGNRQLANLTNVNIVMEWQPQEIIAVLRVELWQQIFLKFISFYRNNSQILVHKSVEYEETLIYFCLLLNDNRENDVRVRPNFEETSKVNGIIDNELGPRPCQACQMVLFFHRKIPCEISDRVLVLSLIIAMCSFFNYYFQLTCFGKK